VVRAVRDMRAAAHPPFRRPRLVIVIVISPQESRP